MCKKIAVAMCVYKNDKLIFLEKAVNSLLEQTSIEFHVYIEVDGPISEEIKIYLESLKKTYYNIFIINFNKEQKGLAFRLNTIIDSVLKKNEYLFLARMDADDYCQKDRLIIQKTFLEENLDIDVVGSDVIEVDDFDKPLFYKKMHSYHKDICKNIIKKCPFNHPTVMIRLCSIKNIRYKEYLKNTQDYFFWIDLLNSGCRFHNIDKPLLYFRLDKNFYSRRGIKKIKNDIYSRIYAMNTLHIWSLRNIFLLVMLITLRISPKVIKKFAYKKYR
ncbi:glycosyltransferase [Proteus mirabilis]|uniref:glycosyltransferase n=2 Tax=Proteus mirabilis TaxID=584 RepID=UPI0021824BFF|nr:glycosyltransferase [Proteus mirabilis]MCT0124408.1 glycosyltransferase [Proteus mirabilis]MDF7337833.1 glycosyltransferase [Proteus mirabilis]